MRKLRNTLLINGSKRNHKGNDRILKMNENENNISKLMDAVKAVLRQGGGRFRAVNAYIKKRRSCHIKKLA